VKEKVEVEVRAEEFVVSSFVISPLVGGAVTYDVSGIVLPG